MIVLFGKLQRDAHYQIIPRHHSEYELVHQKIKDKLLTIYTNI